MTLPLNPGEIVAFQEHPGSWNMAPNYVATLGLYGVKRKATMITVTNQRVIVQSGIVTRREQSVPIGMVQDAIVETRLGVGWVVLSSAGRRGAVMKLGPFTSSVAQRLADTILAQQQQEIA